MNLNSINQNTNTNQESLKLFNEYFMIDDVMLNRRIQNTQRFYTFQQNVKPFLTWHEDQQLQINFTYLSLKSQQGNIVVAYLFDEFTQHELIQGLLIALYGSKQTQNLIIFSNDRIENYYVLEPLILVSHTKLKAIYSKNYCSRKEIIKGIMTKKQFTNNENRFNDGNNVEDFFVDIASNLKKYQYLFDEIQQMNKEQNNIPQVQKKYLEFTKKEINEINIKKSEEGLFKEFINCLSWIDKYINQQQKLELQGANSNYEIQFTQKFEKHKARSSILGFKGVLDIIIKCKCKIDQQSQNEIFIPLDIKVMKSEKQNYPKEQIELYSLLLSKINNFESNELCPFGIYFDSTSSVSHLVEFNQNIKQILINKRNQFVFQNSNFLLDFQISQLPKLCGLYKYVKQTKQKYRQSDQFGNEDKGRCNGCQMKDTCFALNIIENEKQPTDLYIEDNQNYHKINQKLDQKSKDYLNNMIKLLTKEQNHKKIHQIEFKAKKLQENIIHFQSIEVYSKIKIITIFNTYFKENVEITLVDKQTKQTFEFKIRSPNHQFNSSQDSQKIELKCDDTNLNKVNIEKHNQFIIYPRYTTIEKQVKQQILHLLILDQNKILKQLLIYNDKPSFYKEWEKDHWFNQLNEQNIEIICPLKQALLAKDYMLFDGDHEQEKNQIVCMLIHSLVVLKKKVLICSDQNEELQEMMKNLVKNYPAYFPKYFREINIENDKQEQQEGVYTSLCSKCKTKIKVNNKDDKEYDYCIVLGASKITEPLTIYCIVNSRTFILVGNVQNQVDATEQELKESLFKRLVGSHKDEKCYWTFNVNTNKEDKIRKQIKKNEY